MLYKSNKSPYWYVDLTNPVTGQRHRVSTRTTDYDEALKFLAEEKAKLSGLSANATLKDVLMLYEDPEKNPRYRQAKIEGRSYGKAYARHVAAYTRQILDLFSAKAPRLLKKKMSAITKLDVKAMREVMAAAWGQTRKSQTIFRTLRAMFSQASEDAIILHSPFEGIKDIHYKSKPALSFPEEILSDMISHKELWPDHLMWAFFSLLATTGMRRSEALALTRDQLYEGVLTIDRAFKDIDGELGLPKWDLMRVIPLSNVTLEILNSIEGKNKRYFPKGQSWVNDVIYTARVVGLTLYPLNKDLGKLTAHSLRHSCHSNLLANGASVVLAAEYLSWGHQELADIQQRYTHIYCKKLQPIADLIDELYTPSKQISIHKKSQSL